MKLYYFDSYGRAEAIRMCLTHAKVPFEDIRLTKEEFEKLKTEKELEFGQLPLIEHEGKIYGQSMALLRHAGRTHGYYPSEAGPAWRIDSLIDSYLDVQS
mmetsp:Transcript_32359/g.31663  ORF Transcript_32359/g.31663 Transcript_32359/m.31663 type:complete len:100 (-) Transcript_32359:381-680(-)